MKKKIIAISICVLLSVVSSNAVFANTADTDETEYWALLIAVGTYYNHPQQDRPCMLEALDELYETLLISENWNPDHIKTISEESATFFNIIRGLIWLDRMEDDDDMSLVWISTHGYPLEYKNRNIDLPPFDEEDGCDEALATYYSFEYPLAIIWDDLLNFFLNRLESKGVCLIVDSCHSGGFDDMDTKGECYQSSQFIQDFIDDIEGQNRVILMSCEEDTVSWGSQFTNYICEGLHGIADDNEDEIVSAEEAFYYAQPLVIEATHGMQHPTIFDCYPGEFPLTFLL